MKREIFTNLLFTWVGRGNLGPRAEVGRGGRTVAMGTRVLIRGSAVAALVQEPTHSSPIATPPVPMVTCVDSRLIDGDVWVVGLRIPSWFSSVVAPLGAPRPGRLLALRVRATVGDVQPSRRVPLAISLVTLRLLTW